MSYLVKHRDNFAKDNFYEELGYVLNFQVPHETFVRRFNAEVGREDIYKPESLYEISGDSVPEWQTFSHKI
jgi:hypothetical protein